MFEDHNLQVSKADSVQYGTIFIRFQMKMKKVNKQCLLDTPRTLRVSKKNLASYSSNQ